MTFSQFALPGLMTGCIYALVALGFVLCANVSGVINFAQGEFVMLGGIVTAVLVSAGFSFGGACLVGVAAGAIIGGLQERLTVAPARNADLFLQATISLGVAIVLRGVALIAFGKDPISMPTFTEGVVTIAGAVLPAQALWVWAFTAFLVAAMFCSLKFTKIGRAVRSCSINPQAARLMGVSLERVTLLVFTVSGAVGALSGILIAPITLALWSSGFDFGLKGFIAALIGGFTSPVVAVIGGLLIGLLEAIAAGYISSGLKDIVVYGTLLAFLLFRGGVFRSRSMTLPRAKQ